MAAVVAAGIVMGPSASAAWPGTETTPAKPMLRVLNWELYIDLDPDVPEDRPTAERSPTLREFAEQFDCELIYDEYHSQEDLSTKFTYMGDYYDIFIFPSALAKPVIQNGWAQPIPRDRVPNVEYVDTVTMSSPADPDGQYLIPYLHSYTGLMYHKDKISADKVTWNDYLYPAPQLRDRVGLEDSAARMFSIALVANGVTNYGEPTHQEILDAQKRLISFYQDSHPVMAKSLDVVRDTLIAEEIWLAPLYSSDAHYIFQYTTNYAFVIPPEGGMLDHDYMIVHRNSHNPELAFAFINYVLTPEISGRIAADVGAEAPSPDARRIQQEIEPLTVPTAINENGECQPGLLTAFDQPANLAAYWYDVVNSSATPAAGKGPGKEDAVRP